MKRVYLLTLIIFIVSIFMVSNISSFAEESGEEIVKCAYDGMEMPKSSMKAKMKYQGNMYYFCTKEERDKFAEDPERYLKREEGSESQYEEDEEMQHGSGEMHEGHGSGSQSNEGHGGSSSGHGGMGCMH